MTMEIKFMAYCKEHGLSNEFELGDVNFTFHKTGFYYPLGLCMDFCTILQHINRKDKNGNDIYTGYIVRGKLSGDSPVKNHLVYYDEDKCGYMPFIDIQDTPRGNENLNPLMCEIVGNEHENPELLNSNKGSD